MFSGNLELCASEISSPRQALIFGHFVYGQAGNWGQADGGHAKPDTHGQVFGSNLFCQIGHQTNLDHTYWHRKICSPPMNSLSNGHPQKLFGKIPLYFLKFDPDLEIDFLRQVYFHLVPQK